MSGDEVADEDEDGHDDVFGDRDDVGAGNFSDGDASVGLVSGVEVDMVGANAGGDGEFEVFRFGKAVGCQVARMEAVRVNHWSDIVFSPALRLSGGDGKLTGW